VIVVGVDLAGRRVTLAEGPALVYDYLILAPGARHSYFNHPEWEALAPGLKTLDDALLVRRQVLLAFERAEREPDAARQAELLTFVIVGGGPTGVELAGTLAEIAGRTLRQEYRSIDTARSRILVIEAGPSVLAAFPERLRDAARASLTRLRVDVREGTRLVGLDAHVDT
jgi:NADH dehydrogenase